MSQYSDAAFMLPPVAFALMFGMGLLVYLFGGLIAAKGKKTPGKLATYTGGEDIPGGKLKQRYNFFHMAFVFTMLHVGALVIATIPALAGDYEQAFFLGLIYLMGVAFVIVTLLAGGADRA